MVDTGDEIFEVNVDGVEDENSRESHNDIPTENVNILDSDRVIVPEVGMVFDDEKAVSQFYCRYAYSVGFPVRKRNSKKDDDGNLRYVTYTCSREGRRSSSATTSLRPQPTIQTGCQARIAISNTACGKWRINSVNLEHNHKTSPTKSRMYRCNRKICSNVKQMLEVNDIAGIPLHKSFNSAVVEAGGYENLAYIEKDCRNYIEKVRRLRLGEGDAASIQAYFCKMQSQCPGFYFSIDLDDDCRLKNLFWANNRCRQAYKEFGDVITFDTTYLTNKYDMPFAPFVGVNHHGESTLLGCGLVSSEDTKTFIWLFRTWLHCMDGQAPSGIITDQDRAMQNAIQVVFPHARHRWCLWHILKKLPEKFGYHADKGAILSALHGVVYDSQCTDEFERDWSLMLDRYDLQDNEWLSGLYKNRARWVPCYLKIGFWAGMSTTQRSESMNSFFDGYVHSKTSLKQFVEQYERALRSKVEKEFQSDFKSFSQMIPCVTRFELENQFQEVYTISKFREVQEEFIGKMYCEVVSSEDGCFGRNYSVCEEVIYNGGHKRNFFTVSFDKSTCQIACSCHLFEFRGIICKHAISVLIRNDVRTLPEAYILRRWRRDVSRAHTRVPLNYDGLVSSPDQIRYDYICKAFAKVADLVLGDEVRYRAVVEWIENQLNELSITKTRTSCERNLHTRQGGEGGSKVVKETCVPSTNIADPKCSHRKGAPKKVRIKGALEQSSKKAKGNSKTGRQTSHIQEGPHARPLDVQPSQEMQLQNTMWNPLSYSQQLHAMQTQLSTSEYFGLNMTTNPRMIEE